MLRVIRIKPIYVIIINQIAYVENKLYKRSDNRTFNNTSNIYKHINQYSTDVFTIRKHNVILLMMLL